MRAGEMLVVFLSTMAAGSFAGAQVAADGTVWVPNNGNNSVSRIDKATNTVTTIGVGLEPRGVAVDPTWVWVTNVPEGTVSRIDKQTNTVTATIAVGGLAGQGIAVDRDYVWVANGAALSASRIDKATLAVTSIPLGKVTFGATTDNTYVWFGNHTEKTVFKVRKADLQLVASIETDVAPHGLTNDHQAVWVAIANTNQVARIDKATDGVTLFPSVGSSYGIVADGASVWTSNAPGGSAVRLDPNTQTWTNEVPVGNDPIGIAIDVDTVWVANRGSNTVSRISKSTNTVVATIPVGPLPYMFGDGTGFAYDLFNAPTLTSISVTPNNPSLNPGQTVPLTATGTFSDASSRPLTAADGLQWSSSNEGSATVDAAGLLTAVSPGSAQVTATSGGISGAVSVSVVPFVLEPALVWVGLKNSDDVGIRFDFKAEVTRIRNGVATLIGSGELTSVQGGSSGFNNARLSEIPLSVIDSPVLASGDTLSFKLLVRNAASGSGKNSGTARLWYNDAEADCRFGAVSSTGTAQYHLRNGAILSSVVGSGPRATIDVAAGAKGSAFKQFGAWTTTIP